MKRRELLATGAALATSTVGGCTGCAAIPTATLDMDTASDAALAREHLYTLESPDHPDYDLLQQAVENDSATRRATNPPLPEQRVVFDERVFEVSYQIVSETPATAFRVTIDPLEKESGKRDAIDYENLPAVDREALAAIGLDDGRPLGINTRLLYLDREIESSVLVPSPNYSVIVWGPSRRGVFSVDGSSETMLRTYRYTTEYVDSAAAVGAELRRRYGFVLRGLSAAEREIVTTAIQEGYRVPQGESPPDAFRSLAKRFKPHSPVRGEAGDLSGTYIVRYEGRVYSTKLRLNEEQFTTQSD